MGYHMDITKFKLKQEYFDHVSSIHGISHTYRVMCHTRFIGEAAGLNRETEIALCAAYIHDLARKHDGYCNQHGLWSARDKLPQFCGFFKIYTYRLFLFCYGFYWISFFIEK